MGSIPIDAMIVAALEAGTEVMRCYDEIPEVTFKSDASPVTNAQRALIDDRRSNSGAVVMPPKASKAASEQ